MSYGLALQTAAIAPPVKVDVCDFAVVVASVKDVGAD